MKRIASVVTILALLWVPSAGVAQPGWLDQLPQELPGHISIKYTQVEHSRRHDDYVASGAHFINDFEKNEDFTYQVSANVTLKLQPDESQGLDYAIFVDDAPVATAQTHEGSGQSVETHQSVIPFQHGDVGPCTELAKEVAEWSIQGQNDELHTARLTVHKQGNGYRYAIEGLPFSPASTHEKGSIVGTNSNPKCGGTDVGLGTTPIDRIGSFFTDFYRGKSDESRGFYELDPQLAGSFDPKAPNFSGSARVESNENDVDKVTVIQWSFGGKPQELEAVMSADGYDDWMPSAGPDELTRGDLLCVNAKLQVKGKLDVQVNSKATFRFELSDVSSEPGVALNWPPKAEVKNTPDLGIEEPYNQPLQLTGQTWETTGTHAAKSAVTKSSDTKAQVCISSFDWGAWGTLKAYADTDDGQHLVAHMTDDPSVEEMKIPKDSDGNHIADAWKKQHPSIPPGMGADASVGIYPLNDFPGDGLSLYEKYRGFMVVDASGTAVHTRKLDPAADPTTKVLFIQNDNAELESGIDLFRAASGLNVYKVSSDGQMDEKRVINFNYKTAHLVDQHGLWLTFGHWDNKRIAGQSPIGPPKYVDKVEIYFACEFPNEDSSFCTSVNDRVVAHELGHAVGMPHPGAGNYSMNIGCCPGRIRPGQIPVSVAVQHGQNSGGADCIMRYPPTDYVERFVMGFKQLDVYPNDDVAPKTRFCNSNEGTGVNAPSHKPWPIAGVATSPCGQSMSFLVVSDLQEGRRRQSQTCSL